MRLFEERIQTKVFSQLSALESCEMSEMMESEGDFNPNKIFVGNLPFVVTSEDLSGLFTSVSSFKPLNICTYFLIVWKNNWSQYS